MKSSTSALRRSTISMLAFLAATALWAVLAARDGRRRDLHREPQ